MAERAARRDELVSLAQKATQVTSFAPTDEVLALRPAGTSRGEIIRGVATSGTTPVVGAPTTTYVADLAAGNYFQLTAGGNITMSAPTGAALGQRVIFEIIQDATGGRTVTWNAAFKVTWSNTGNTTEKRSVVQFVVSNATGPVLTQAAAQSPYN